MNEIKQVFIAKQKTVLKYIRRKNVKKSKKN